MKTYQFYLQFYRRYLRGAGRRIAVLILLIAVGVGISNIAPYLYGKLLDLIALGKIEILPAVLLGYLGVQLGEQILGNAEDYYGAGTSYRLLERRKNRLFEKMTSLRCCELDQKETGELFTRLESDVETILDFFLNAVTALFSITFTLLVALGFIFRISAFLAVVAILFIPAAVGVTQAFKKPFQQVQKRQKEFQDRYYTFLSSVLPKIADIRAFCMEKRERKTYAALLREQWGILSRTKLLGYGASLARTLISAGSAVVLMYLSARLILAGKFSIGNMVAFLTYMGRLKGAVEEFLALNLEAQSVKICMERIGELENAGDESGLYLPDRKRNRQLSHLALQSVWFSYETEPVLQGVDVTIRTPGLYTLVGKNGCGKSTLLKLLVRNYDSLQGSILLNEIPIEEYDLGEVRSRILYLSKTPYLSDRTVMEHLQMVSPGLTEHEILKQLSACGITQMESAFPCGLATRVGEDGCLLSSGQRQKLNIARAILVNPDILLLDEVTSDLDGKAEKEYLRLLQTFAKEKIVLQAAHRIAAVEASDCIYVMEAGKICEWGSPKQLLHGSRLCQEMFAHQKTDASK